MSEPTTMPELIQEFQQEMIRFRELIPGRMDRIEADHKAQATKIDAELFKLKQRSARLPGAGPIGDEGSATQPLLQQHKELNLWLKSPRGRQSNFTTEVPFQWQQKAAITGAGGITHAAGIAGPQQPALRLAELIPDIPITAGSAVEYSREVSFVPGASVQTAEGALKTETITTFANVLATVRTVATWTKASLQSLSDSPGLQDWLDQRLRHSVLLAAESLFLNAPAPDGLLASAVVLDAAFTPGTGGTALDYIGAAIGQLQSGGYSVDGVVLSGTDSSAMRLLKNSQGEYLWATPASPLGVTAVWSIPVVVSPSMPAGSFLVGAFRQSTVLFNRQRLTVEIAYENEDDFKRNLACLRGEERCALAIPVPQGLITGTLPAIPPAALAAKK